MMSTCTGVRALVMVTLCYGALEIVGLLLLLLLLLMSLFVKIKFTVHKTYGGLGYERFAEQYA